MGRVEYKYLVSNAQLTKLCNALGPHLKLDKYSAMCEQKEYVVRSIYFDTPRLAYYHDKLAGIRKRKKVRIRGYNEFEQDSKVFLEIKRKNGATISKTRANIDFKSLGFLMGGYYKPLESFPELDIDRKNFFYHVFSSQLKPLIKIVYEREAFFFKFNENLRITFDKNIRSSLHSQLQDLYKETRMVPVFKNYFILEVKTEAQFPRWLSNILANFNLQNEALSKYTLSLDSHRYYSPNLDELLFQNKRYINQYTFI